LNIESSLSPHPSYLRWLLLFYSVLIIYGTLYPLSGWNTEFGGIQELLQLKWPSHFSRGDVLVNFIVYIPFGYLLGLSLNSRHQYRTILFTTLAGFLLCANLEYLQTFLPNRVPSLLDILLNTIGSLVGSLLSILLGYHSNFAKKLKQLKHELLLPTPLSNLVVLSAFFWILAQLTPLVPSPDIGNLRAGIKPLWLFIQHPSDFDFHKFISYTLNITGLGILMISFNRPNHPMLGKMIALFFLVLVAKIPIVDRALSMEALLGFICALPLWLLLDIRSAKVKAIFIIFCVLSAYTIDGLQSDANSLQLLQPMNWIPFHHQMGDVVGLVDLLLSIWPFMVLAAAVLMIRQSPSTMMIVVLISLVTLYCYFIENMQLRLAGRYADITDILVACSSFTWCLIKYRKSSYTKPDYDYSIVGELHETE